MAGDLDSDPPAVRLGRVFLVGAANQLDVKSVGWMRGGRRPVQKKQCGKQSGENSASHKLNA